MKKIIVTMALLLSVIITAIPVGARAAETSDTTETTETNENAKDINDLLNEKLEIDGFNPYLYKYRFAWEFIYYNSRGPQTVKQIIVSKKPLVYCDRYKTEELDYIIHPYDCIHVDNKCKLKENDDSLVYEYSDIIGRSPGDVLNVYNEKWDDMYGAITLTNNFISNSDIINQETGTVVFRKASLNLGQSVKEAMKTTNPLSQILGLIPLLIPLAVSFLALRKGWALLSRVLRKA